MQTAEALTYGMFKNQSLKPLQKVPEKFMQPPFKGKKEKVYNVEAVPNRFPSISIKQNSLIASGNCPNKYI